MLTKPEVVEHKPGITTLECPAEPKVPSDDALKKDVDGLSYFEAVRVAGDTCRKKLAVLRHLFYPEDVN